MVLVHGLSNVAGDYHEARAVFKANGYTDAEFYATTYGKWGQHTSVEDVLECDFVKQVNFLLHWRQLRYSTVHKSSVLT